MPRPLAPPVMTMTSSSRSTRRGAPWATRWLTAAAIQQRETSEAQAAAASIGGDSHLTVRARRHSGINQQTNGCSSVTPRTRSSRSTERGANHESRCGGRGWPDMMARLRTGEDEGERIACEGRRGNCPRWFAGVRSGYNRKEAASPAFVSARLERREVAGIASAARVRVEDEV